MQSAGRVDARPRSSAESGPPPVPSCISLPGVGCPGSPVLGDARALTSFLLQRRIGRADRLQEEVGWVVFGGAELDEGGELLLEIDLGAGPVRIPFQVPAP